jgi:hypothetical protein
MAWIVLARQRGLGREFALDVVRRPQASLRRGAPVAALVDVSAAFSALTPTHAGASDLSAQRTSSCPRWSMWPPRATLCPHGPQSPAVGDDDGAVLGVGFETWVARNWEGTGNAPPVY